MDELVMQKAEHQQRLQIHGVHIPGASPIVERNGAPYFRAAEICFGGGEGRGEPVPLRIPVVPDRLPTPYSLRHEVLYYRDSPLRLPGTAIHVTHLPPEEDQWHLKGYTLPFVGTWNPFRELRINPRITGECPGRCVFCHRGHSQHLSNELRKDRKPAEIVAALLEAEGQDVLKRVKQVMLITELFGQAPAFLRCVAETRDALIAAGYPASRPFGCCANDVRSPAALKAALLLVRPARYSFSLESFTRRDELMGPYKGIPIPKVYQVLQNARDAGFSEIQLNYLAGIDSLQDCERGFEALVKRGLVDSVGLSTFTCFAEEQIGYRHPQAWRPEYYVRVVRQLASLGIHLYRPESYNMRVPFALDPSWVPEGAPASRNAVPAQQPA